jgi:hypothetical protein
MAEHPEKFSHWSSEDLAAQHVNFDALDLISWCAIGAGISAVLMAVVIARRTPVSWAVHVTWSITCALACMYLMVFDGMIDIFTLGSLAVLAAMIWLTWTPRVRQHHGLPREPAERGQAPSRG